MTQPYKLKDEIKAFILEKKKRDPIISCRQLVPLIWEHFQLKLSKSSVNAILKEYRLSSHVGRRQIRPRKTPLIQSLELPKLVEPSIETPSSPAEVTADKEVEKIAPAVSSEISPVVTPGALPTSTATPDPVLAPKKQVIELISTRRDIEYVVNCGCFMLRAADLKNSFTDSLAIQIANSVPDLDREVIYFVLEALIYKQIFKSDNDLWRFLGSELTAESFSRVSERIFGGDAAYSQAYLSGVIDKDKCLDIKELNNQRLQRLNALVKEAFFPAAYQSLDFATMYARFFCLIGRLERKGTLLAIRLFYPPNFQWAYDIVWQDDFQNAVNKINQEHIMTLEGEKIWFDTSIGFQK